MFIEQQRIHGSWTQRASCFSSEFIKEMGPVGILSGLGDSQMGPRSQKEGFLFRLQERSVSRTEVGPALGCTGWCRIPSDDANDAGRIRKGRQEPDPEGLDRNRDQGGV